MRVAVYPAQIVGFDLTQRLVTLRIEDGWTLPHIGIGDPAELRPNPGQKVACPFCGGIDGYPGDHGPDCPSNPHRP